MNVGSLTRFKETSRYMFVKPHFNSVFK